MLPRIGFIPRLPSAPAGVKQYAQALRNRLRPGATAPVPAAVAARAILPEAHQGSGPFVRPAMTPRDRILSAKAKVDQVRIERPYILGEFARSHFEEIAFESWDDLKPAYDELLARAEAVGSLAELEALIADLNDVIFITQDASTAAEVVFYQNTQDDDAKTAHLNMEAIDKDALKARKAIEKLVLASVYFAELPNDAYGTYKTKLAAELRYYREANVEREKRMDELSAEFSAAFGAIRVTIPGHDEMDIAQAGKLLKSTDRKTREDTWRAIQEVHKGHRAKIDAIYDEMLKLAEGIATEAGFDNYRDYIFASKLYNYSPTDLEAFHVAVEQHVVPLCRAIDEAKRKNLGLEKLEPWDKSAPPKGKEPIQAYDKADIDGFMDKVATLLGGFEHPIFADVFQDMVDLELYDVGHRDGKRPGGFAAQFWVSGSGFFFSNDNGMGVALWKVVHELSHAIHRYLARHIPLYSGRVAPGEVNDTVAFALQAMSMEHWESFYPDEAIRNQAKLEHLEWMVKIIRWSAVVDAYEHWNYSHPGHSVEERDEAYMRIALRFGLTDIDIDQTPDWRSDIKAQATLSGIKHQAHTYSKGYHLRYATTYGFSMFQALRLYSAYQAAKSPEARREVLENFLRGQKQGGLVTPNEVFATMGAPFNMAGAGIAADMAAIAEEMEALRG
jgi:oligoendopeptidase F